MKRSINFKMSNTLFRVSFVVLCSRIGTQLTTKPPPPPWAYLPSWMRLKPVNARPEVKDIYYYTVYTSIQQAPRKIYLYKRADIDGLRDHLARYRDSFLSPDHSHMSVNDMWVSLSPRSSRLLKGLFRQK